MIKVFAILLVVSSFHLAFSQGPGTTRYLDQKIEEDGFINRLYECIPKKEKYWYSEFREGYVYYVTRTQSSPANLNYNLYRSLISMIDEKGDTVFVANFEIIKYISIGKDLFYHDFNKGYFEIISDPNDSIRLVVQRQLNISKREVLMDHEKPQTVSNKKYFSVIYTPANPTLHREKVTLSRDDVFFLMDKKDETLIASHASFLKLFPDFKEDINHYLIQMARKKNRIKFQNENDLKNLLQFCLSLQK